MPTSLPVLIVDDTATVRRMLLHMAEVCGAEAVGAATGEQALCTLRDRRFGLCVVDLTLSDMTGFEVVAVARAAGIETTFVGLTGWAIDRDMRRRAEAVGMAALLSKPPDFSALIELVREHATPSPGPRR